MNELHQMDRIEAKIDALLNAPKSEAKQLDIKTFQRMMNFIKDKKKIEAIKECRVLMGIGLKEAKDLIEDYLT